MEVVEAASAQEILFYSLGSARLQEPILRLTQLQFASPSIHGSMFSSHAWFGFPPMSRKELCQALQ